MAVVYLARDRKHDREVAVKVLRPELAAALGVERFLREIRIAAGLQHPNILPLYDSGEADGLLYYVMPYVAGDSLRDRIRKGGPMALADALGVVSETADALGYAHSHNVVHRDIKPENILISGGHALVADFGIARAITAAGGDRVTETGVSVGTPAYMSPEQALADPQVDGRADIYALGCVLYEMLAGEPPFTGPTAQAVIARHSVDPVPPLTTVRPGVPAEVDAAMRRALAKVPADRYPTAADFRAALSGARPAAGPRAPTGRRWVVAAAAAVMLISLISAALFLRRPADAGPPSVAVLPFRNLSSDPDDEAFSDGMAEELTAALSKIEGVRVAAPNSAATFRNASASPQAIGKALGVGTVVEGSVLRAGGRWRVVTHLTSTVTGYDLWSDIYERDAKDVFTVQDEIVRAVVGALRVRLTGAATAAVVSRRTGNPEAHELYLKGRYFYEQRTADGLRKGLEFFRRAIALDSSYALAYSGLADAQSLLSSFGYEPPAVMFPAAKRAALRAIALDSTLPEGHTSLGFVSLFYDWDWATADRELRTAQRLDSTFTPALLFHGWYDIAVGHPDSAIADLTRARTMDPLSLILNARLANMLYFARRFDQAIVQARQALTLDPGYGPAHGLLAQLYLKLGRCGEATSEAAREGAAYGYEAFLGGVIAARCGRKQDAEAAVARLKATIRSGRYVSPEAVAIVYSALGQRDSAFAWLDRAYADRTWSLYTMKADPMLDGLHSDARFAALARRIGLP